MPAALVAYPGRPPEVGREIETAIKSLSQSHGQHEIKSWVGNDICGRFLVDPILEKIDGAEFLIAAITALNFNVAFEIG